MAVTKADFNTLAGASELGNIKNKFDAIEASLTTGGQSSTPVITLSGSTTVNVPVGGSFTDSGATATDSIDGNLTSSIVTTGTVDVNTVGVYNITYSVTNTLGVSSSITRIVTVTSATSINTFSFINTGTSGEEIISLGAPTGDTISVDWGDGTTDTQVSAGEDFISFTHTYSTIGNTIVLSATNGADSFTYIDINARVSGDFPDLSNSSVNQFYLYGPSQITGNLILPTDLSNLVIFNIVSNQISGTVPNLSGAINLTHFIVNDNQLDGYAGGVIPATFVSFYNNNLSEATVDLIIQSCIDSGNNNGVLYLAGDTIATSTTTGRDTLLGMGWVVQVNTTSDYVPPPSTGGVTTNTIDLIMADRDDANTGSPSGTSSAYDLFNKVVRNFPFDGSFPQTNIWYEVLEGGNGLGCSFPTNPATNTVIELGRMSVWIYYTNGGWELAYDGNDHGTPSGSGTRHPHTSDNYVNDIAGIQNYYGCPDVGALRLSNMGYDVTAGFSATGNGLYKPAHDWFYHGWMTSLIPLDFARGPQALYSTMWARVVVQNPALPDDRDQSNYVVHIGGDKKEANGATTQGDVGMSRWKRLTRDWQPITFLTGGWSKEQFAATNPSISNTP